MAEASLGILRTRQGQFDEARKSLQEAVAGNSNNYLADYYYGFAVSREGMDSTNMITGYSPESASVMRAELKKAIELNPGFPESYSLLAFVNMVTGEELDQAIRLLQRALALSPGRQDLRLELAQVYLRKQKLDLARQILEPLRNAKDRQLHKQAEMLLDSIRRYQDQISQFNSARDLPGSETPRLRRHDESSTVVTESNQTPKSESDYLQAALRPVESGEQRIQGLFIKLDCDSKGVAYFSVQTGNRMYRIRATALGRVQLTAYVQAPAEVSCGARKNPENVVLTYRPTSDPKTHAQRSMETQSPLNLCRRISS
jgi:Tetratricopeptide repeat